MNYLSLLPDSAHTDAIIAEHKRLQKWVGQEKKGFLRYRNPFLQLTHYPADHVDCTGDTVIIGRPEEINEDAAAAGNKTSQEFYALEKRAIFRVWHRH